MNSSEVGARFNELQGNITAKAKELGAVGLLGLAGFVSIPIPHYEPIALGSPTIEAGRYYSITLPNKTVIYPKSSIEFSTIEGFNDFMRQPWNHLGFKYLTNTNTINYSIIKEKGKVLWLDLHSSKRGNLPGDAIVESEKSFYNNPYMYIGNEKMQVQDIQVVDVHDVVSDTTKFSDRLVGAAAKMRGHTFIQTCYPPYRPDGTGNNDLLIGLEKVW